MNPPPRPVTLESTEVIVGRDPGRKVMRQLSPRTARANHIEDRIDHLAHVNGTRASARRGRRNRRPDQSPLLARHVSWVRFPFHTPVSAESAVLKHLLRASILYFRSGIAILTTQLPRHDYFSFCRRPVPIAIVQLLAAARHGLGRPDGRGRSDKNPGTGRIGKGVTKGLTKCKKEATVSHGLTRS